MFYKIAVLKVLNIHMKTPMLKSLFNKVQGWRSATLLKRDSNIGVFLWIFLFTNSYRITCCSFCIDIFGKSVYKQKNLTPIKRAGILVKLKEECQQNFDSELEAK